MLDMGVGYGAKGASQQDTEKVEPDIRPVPGRVWDARPRASGLAGSTHVQRPRLPTPDPLRPRSLHSKAPRVNSERPSPGKQQSQRTVEADTHLAGPHRKLGPPGQTTATTGNGGSQRANPRPNPSRKNLQVPLNTRSPLPPPLPSFCSPAGAPGLARVRAPRDVHARGTDATQPLVGARSRLRSRSADVGKNVVPGGRMRFPNWPLKSALVGPAQLLSTPPSLPKHAYFWGHGNRLDKAPGTKGGGA